MTWTISIVVLTRSVAGDEKKLFFGHLLNRDEDLAPMVLVDVQIIGDLDDFDCRFDAIGCRR